MFKNTPGFRGSANGIGVVYIATLTYQLAKDPANTKIDTPHPSVVSIAAMSSAPTTTVMFDMHTGQGNRTDIATLLRLFEKYGGEQT